MKEILITGGNGFIGHHFCEHIMKNTNWHLNIMDKLTYASSGYDRLRDINCYDDKRIRHFAHDFVQPIESYLRSELEDVEYIVHIGAETHVDNSISNPEPFVKSNVVGTFNMLQFARTCPNLKRFIYFSTDEIFGPAPEGVNYKEWDRYNSTNPYSATKAGGEELVLAWGNTYKVPVLISHTMNCFGERQHPEKFIPRVIRACLSGEKIYIHADSTKTKPGSRFWIHARNVSAAILFLIEKGEQREKYNIVGEVEMDNLQLALLISKFVGKPLNYELVDFHSSRPGHDLRYALDGTKLKDMGFDFPKSFEATLEKTVQWTLNSPKWLELKK